MSSSADQSVRVAVRIRPLVPSEQKRGCESIVKKAELQPQVVVNPRAKNSDRYTFNYVFAPEDTQEMVYENAAKCMIDKLFKGKPYIAEFLVIVVVVVFDLVKVLERNRE